MKNIVNPTPKPKPKPDDHFEVKKWILVLDFDSSELNAPIIIPEV